MNKDRKQALIEAIPKLKKLLSSGRLSAKEVIRVSKKYFKLKDELNEMEQKESRSFECFVCKGTFETDEPAVLHYGKNEGDDDTHSLCDDCAKDVVDTLDELNKTR